jgi:hypothetical protein
MHRSLKIKTVIHFFLSVTVEIVVIDMRRVRTHYRARGCRYVTQKQIVKTMRSADKNTKHHVYRAI